MSVLEPFAWWEPMVAFGAITTLMTVPASIVLTIAAFFGIQRQRVDTYVAESLDRFLTQEAKALRKRVGKKLLNFRASESVHAMALGLGWGRLRVHRTVLSSLKDGYRVRIRVYAHGARGRVIVRYRDVDLRARR